MTGVARRTREAIATGRSARGPDERGSLPLVMLIMMVGLAMAALVVPILLTQDRSTVFVASRVDSLAAAQTGVDVLTGRIRAATASGAGDSTRIPCAPERAPLTGGVGAPGTGRYSVWVAYYVVDPVQNPGATPMLCVPNRGTYTAETTTPGYAQITSTGVDGPVGAIGAGGRSDGRTVVTTYVFKTTNRNVPGGRIVISPSDAGPPLCLDGGSALPQAGALLALKTCSTSVPPSPQQVFSYRTDLTLQLVTSATPGYPNGLCVDTDTSTGAPADGKSAHLTPCAALGSPPFSQQWSYNDGGQFQAALANSVRDGVLAALCITSNGRDAPATLTGCFNSSAGTKVWLPEPDIGNGAAAPPQLVNYQQFGRCLDVYQADINYDRDINSPSLIAFPCKQNPRPGAVTWNQKFAYKPFAGDPAHGWLTVTKDGDPTLYCLSSPRTEDALVRVTPCTRPGAVAGVTADQLTWSSKGGSASVSYAQRSTFVDSSTDATRCLSVGPLRTAVSPNDPWSWVTVAACDGSTGQKWNADPNLGAAALQNTVEK